MAFFSDDVDEALQYAKHPPTIIYVFHPSEVLKVVDMTTLNNINIFETISKSCQIPPVFISQFASTNAAANKNVEDDFFNMMQAVGEIHGVHPQTLQEFQRSDRASQAFHQQPGFRSGCN